jgi:hypothetical protein
MVFEQTVQLTNVAEEPEVRRVVLQLDQPTQDGDTEIVLLTNLPAAAADAVRVSELYRQRWTIEGLFHNVTVALRCEINTLAYPRAALLGFAVALVANNLLAVVQAALRAAHGAAATAEVSYYYVAEELAGTYRGMMVAVPEEQWQVFAGMPAAPLAELLRQWAAQVRLRAFRKHRRGPKKKAPPRPLLKNQRHVATAKLLARRGDNG